MDSVQNRAGTEHHENNNKKKLNNESLFPSSTSSPSHEFSFTVSLHSSNLDGSGLCGRLAGPGAVLDRSTAAKSPNNSFAIDLSPADDIFFHGHLLPLRILSHLTPPAASPRPSTNSLNGFSILDEQKNLNHEQENCARQRQRPRLAASSKSDSKIACKSKSFSLFGMPTWRKVVSEVRRQKATSPNPNTNASSSKKSLVLEDVSQLLKRYIRILRPLLFLKRNNRQVDEDRDDNIEDPELNFCRQQCSSFSGNLSARRTDKNELHVRSGTSEIFSSAPARRGLPRRTAGHWSRPQQPLSRAARAARWRSCRRRFRQPSPTARTPMLQLRKGRH